MTPGELLKRPLRLPADCTPTTKRETVSERFAPILRAGPVGPAAIGDGTRLRGKHPGGWYYNKTLWAVERSELPVVVRGARIDGPGTLRFGHRSSELDAALVLNRKTSADSDPAGWTDHPSYTRIREPGCYAFQIDGGGFSSTITFQVVGSRSGSDTEARQTTWKTYRDDIRGFSVRIPPRWRRTALDPNAVDPMPLVNLRTGPGGGGYCAHEGDETLRRDAAQISVQERLDPQGDDRFVLRPDHFVAEDVDPNQQIPCPNHAGAIAIHGFALFTDEQRAFVVLVAIGRDTSRKQRYEVFEILDSLRFDPP